MDCFISLNPIVLGIFPPPITGILLPVTIFGIVGFLSCYFHRYLVFIVLPIFIGFCIYLINDLEFFVDLLSGYMAIVYSTMLVSVIAITVGTTMSWKKYRNNFSKLK
jgi:hypothetical protein